ncbi:MAG TPA: hypothetical protein ENL06_02450 [Candidatus Portnoybacteria bacterium]|nr:hypothetical protein [Candidatus Portnoybacteria bacterium]
MEQNSKNYEKIYQLIIIGAGPAGLVGSIYASRYKIDHLVITENIGGLVFGPHKIENFPSYLEITGIKLVQKIEDQAKKLGGKFFIDKMDYINSQKNIFEISTLSGKKFLTETILIACGTERNKIGVKGEKKLTGKGISYCSTCDANFFVRKIVGVVGGGDSAVRAAIYLSGIAKQVFLIHRGNKLTAGTSWQEILSQKSNVNIILNNEVKKIIGQERLEKIKLKNKFNNSDELVLDGLFIEIGGRPSQQLVQELKVKTDERGYIKIDPSGKTSQKGIWAAGDITTGSNNFRQILTACAEGAIAVNSIYKFIGSKIGKK